MTNHWIDYKHSDVIMAIGGNTAENHPISMKWIEKAREEKGAKLMCVDPRLCRTAAVSDLFVPIRPGTNIAFLGWLINYTLQNEKYHEEYVVNYTNASYLVREDFSFDDQEGVFSGIEDDPDRNAKKYDRETWQYQTDGEGNPLKDLTMEDPNCVLQLMKDFYARYDVDTISHVTGCPRETLLEAAEMYCATGEPGQAGNILYAMGITQFTHGAQNTRAIAMLQLLLGNMGIAGGGVNAQRGQSNVQGATDMAILYHIIPGYNPAPQEATHPTLSDYLEQTTPASGWWTNRPKYIVSLLKAFYGDNATPENDFNYDYLPKLDGKDHSHVAAYKDMSEGKVKGMICWADNPVVSGPTAGDKREYQKKLDWMVSVDVMENETAAFWKAPGVDPTEVETEVFLLPATMAYEREGTKSNSGRWVQWQWKAQNAPGDCRSDLWIANELFKRVQKLYREEGGVVPEAITELAWDYDGPDGEVDTEKVCLEINGYNVADGSPVENFVALEDDGSTVCGNWVLSGYYNDPEDPPCKRRIREKEGIGANPDWSFAWPLNRRIVYNRCSADPEGNPWNPDVPVVWWENDELKTNDVPDWPGAWTREESAEFPFIMLPEGQGRLFCIDALLDGPFPLHYEPAESPVANILYPRATANPISQRFYEDHLAENGKYPIIMTTYRVVEHYQTGSLTRNMPWLNEMMPELFIEISEELAGEKGIKNGDMVIIESHRGEIQAKACVTKRLKPLQGEGQVVYHTVGMPFHWGYTGMAKGDVTNELSPSIGDPNTTIPEFKAFLCDIRRA